MHRVKPDRPRMRASGTKKKPVKYEQPIGTVAVPYFGPRCVSEQRLSDRGNPIVWTEGEKKTLLIDQLGYAAIGITGCHNWSDGEANQNGDGIMWAKPFRKYAERFVAGRRHMICFDADAFSNDNVVLAMRRLAGLLLDGGAASVKVVRVPPDAKDPDRGVGVDDHFVACGRDGRIVAALFEKAEPIAAGEELTPIPPKDPLLRLASLAWLRGAGLDGDLRLPPRFEIRRDRSLWAEPASDKPEADQREIMRSVILPTLIMRELSGDEQRVEVAYFAFGQWRTAVVDRKACRDARRALGDFPPSAAIDSNNAPFVVMWLGEYLRHNEHRLPTQRFVSSCGWQDDLGDGERCFLLDEPVTSNETSSVVADATGERAGMLAALKPRGDYDAHVEALRSAFDADPVAAITILGALAAPLLGPLGAPNFAIHLPGESSRGKTSIVKIASSVYGNPCNGQWVGSWNATPVAMEVRAATLTHLPLCFDEVGAGDARVIERAVYMLINGEGKARSDKALQVRAVRTWKTIVLSTGEHELATEQANTGAQVRVLQFRVAGFGSLDGAGVDALRERCEKNHGHVGRAWIESLVAIEDWTPYLELFEKAKKQFRAKEPGSLMQRQSVYFALLSVAEHLAHGAIGIGKADGATVRKVYGDSERRREVQSNGDRALEILSEWVTSEPLSFPLLEVNAAGELIAKTAANVRQINGVRHRGTVNFLPGEMRARLLGHGISSSEAIAAWSDIGILKKDDPSRRGATRIKWNGKRTRVVSIECEALGIDEAETVAVQTVAQFAD
jgi:hypothetical protein